MSVIIRAKAVPSKELAKALGVSDRRYRALVGLADSPSPKVGTRKPAGGEVRVELSRKGWSVVLNGKGGVSGRELFHRKSDALGAARALVREAKADRLVVHLRNCDVQDTFQYAAAAD